MVSNYKILRKANLADELFVGEMDEAALTQEQADRDWARDQDADLVEDIATATSAPIVLRPAGPGPGSVAELGEAKGAPGPVPVAKPATQPAAEPVTRPVSESVSQTGPAPLVQAVEEAVAEAEAEAPESKELVAVSPERGWTQILADLTKNSHLEGVRVLGVCGLCRDSGGSDAAAALAHWAAEHSKKPVLLVEAHFRAPRLAAKLDVVDVGLAEALLEGKPLEEAIQKTSDPNLEILTAGGPFGWLSRGKAAAALPTLFDSLRERFDAIVVQLPAADDPLLAKLPIRSLTDAVILVADPKKAPPGKLSRGADRLREAHAPLAAAMLCSTQSLSAALRRGQLARRVQPGLLQSAI